MFITFEGIEGSSKTTQAILLSQWLNELKIGHLLTKEPGASISKECRQIRKLLLDPESDIVSKAEFFLYLADRAQHVEKIIRPALDEGKLVISDRYSDSTYVYQGWGRRLDSEKIGPMIDFAANYVEPDITFTQLEQVKAEVLKQIYPTFQELEIDIVGEVPRGVYSKCGDDHKKKDKKSRNKKDTLIEEAQKHKPHRRKTQHRLRPRRTIIRRFDNRINGTIDLFPGHGRLHPARRSMEGL
ncbi:hypothetical protein LCGC14_2887780, partial [marine sediment metagenome]